MAINLVDGWPSLLLLLTKWYSLLRLRPAVVRSLEQFAAQAAVAE
jgi:hypothetical protein